MRSVGQPPSPQPSPPGEGAGNQSLTSALSPDGRGSSLGRSILGGVGGRVGWQAPALDLRQLAGEALLMNATRSFLSWSVRSSFLTFSSSYGFGWPPLAYHSTTSSSVFCEPSCMYGARQGDVADVGVLNAPWSFSSLVIS